MDAITKRAEPADSQSEFAILKSMISASADACWCMEFGIPVDLTAPDREVVRQVFDNDPYWRFCNESMEKLYRLPVEINILDRPVHEIFERNDQNMKFVENLLRNGFEINAAPALDKRYDGSDIYVENDVRAYIEDAKLYRIFGVVRDVTKQRRRENILIDQLSLSNTIFTILPEAMIAVDSQELIVAANPAADSLFTDLSDTLVGTQLSIHLKGSSEEDGESWISFLRNKLLSLDAGMSDASIFTLPLADGRMAEWRVARGPKNETLHFVATIRVITESNLVPQRLQRELRGVMT